MRQKAGVKLDIDKADMYRELVISMWDAKPTERLIEMFYQMAKKLADVFPNVIEEDKNDAISFVMEGLLSRYHKFDFNRTNPFSYYTTTITNLIVNSYPQMKRDGVSIDAILGGDTQP